MKVMISIPMNGRKDEEINNDIKRITKKFNNLHIDVVNTFFDNLPIPKEVNIPVYYLSKSIEKLSEVDAIYMAKGWRDARGCKVEFEIAKRYGIKILNSDFIENEVDVERGEY